MNKQNTQQPGTVPAGTAPSGAAAGMQNAAAAPLYQNVSSMDLTTPIDITAVQTAVRAHGNLLVTIQSLAAAEILKHFTAMPGIRDSYTLGRTELGSISRKYTGIFKGQVRSGKIVPRMHRKVLERRSMASFSYTGEKSR